MDDVWIITRAAELTAPRPSSRTRFPHSLEASVEHACLEGAVLVFALLQLDEDRERVQNGALVLEEDVPLLAGDGISAVEFVRRLVVVQLDREHDHPHDQQVADERPVPVEEAPHQMPFFRRYSGSPMQAANRISKDGLSPLYTIVSCTTPPTPTPKRTRSRESRSCQRRLRATQERLKAFPAPCEEWYGEAGTRYTGLLPRRTRFQPPSRVEERQFMGMRTAWLERKYHQTDSERCNSAAVVSFQDLAENSR